MENPEKFSSIRGVAFGSKPPLNPFDHITTTPTATAAASTSGSKRYWSPWGSSSNIFRSFNASTLRSLSRSSSQFTDISHFCDLDDEGEKDLYPIEDDEDLYPCYWQEKDLEDISCSSKCMEDGHNIKQEEQDRRSISEQPLFKSKREQTQKPSKPKESRLAVLLLDQGLFTVYKQLFVICLTINITFLVLSATGNFEYGKNRAALFSIGNVLALTLCRSELCLRFVFFIVVKVFGPSWVPFCIKTAITSLLQSLGGIHSGCGLSSIAWIIYALVLTLRHTENTSPEIIAVASAILSLLSLSSLAAFPLVRHLHHNVFERTHRFAGWTALALIWAFILLTISYDPKTKTYNSIHFSRLVRVEEVWLSTATTVLIILPWITVRRVQVNVSAPSNHATIIKFEGGMRPGLLGRISRSPLSEWHAFVQEQEQNGRMENLEKFSSIRGVAFGSKPPLNPFDITTTTPTATAAASTSGSKRYWSPWGSSSNIFRSFNASTLRSLSRSSSQFTDISHFCDLDDEGEKDLYPIEDDEDLYPCYWQEKDLEDISCSSKCMEDGHNIKQEEQDRRSISEQPLFKSKREQTQKPSKPKESRLAVLLLDQGLFTVYKQLFVICLTINITFLVLSATGNFEYGKNRAALFSICNVLALTLCRSELCLRFVFFVVVKVFGPSWVPFCIKTAITSLLQSLGGIHSGCGLSSIAWIVYALVLTLRHTENTSPEIIAVASAILSLLSLSSLAAFPLVRHLHHNVFERTHRFAGWTALALIWSFILLTISYNPKTKTYNSIHFSRLIRVEEVWLSTATTVLIILPWITVRRVQVNVSAPSNHATIIKFEGGMRPGLLGRISRSPLSEWHAFGIISDGKNEHMMLASAVGDFTRSLVSNPPSHLWIRGVHFAGLPYLLNMYGRVLVVATGSGIGVYLSFLLQPCAADIYLLWVAKGIERNFGKEIEEWVSGYPKEKVIVHDTEVHGRPNVSKMSVDAARNWGVELVVVTSNPEGSRDVVNACKGIGISAFGPIWDS